MDGVSIHAVVRDIPDLGTVGQGSDQTDTGIDPDSCRYGVFDNLSRHIGETIQIEVGIVGLRRLNFNRQIAAHAAIFGIEGGAHFIMDPLRLHQNTDLFAGNRLEVENMFIIKLIAHTAPRRGIGKDFTIGVIVNRLGHNDRLHGAFEERPTPWINSCYRGRGGELGL